MEEKDEKKEVLNNKNQKGNVPNLNIMSFAFELGYSIVVPLVLFALLGRWGDRSFGTTPWLTIGGIVLSIFLSVFIIYRKVTDILRKF